MTARGDQYQQAVSYFLGALSEAEQGVVEVRYFEDEAYSRFLDSAEDRLIDEYLCGKLDLKLTEAFEGRYLISKRRREKVCSARALQNESCAGKGNPGSAVDRKFSLRRQLEILFWLPNPAQAVVFMAVMFLLLLGGLWRAGLPETVQTAKIASENQPPVVKAPNQFLSSARSIPNKNLRDANAKDKQTNKTGRIKTAAKSNSEKLKIALPVKTKSNSLPAVSPAEFVAEKSLIIESNDAKNIRLRVAHKDAREFVSYRVEIHAADGDLLWSREIAAGEKTSQKTLALAVRRGALVGSPRYGLTISGATSDGQLEEINFYNFSLQKK